MTRAFPPPCGEGGLGRSPSRVGVLAPASGRLAPTPPPRSRCARGGPLRKGGRRPPVHHARKRQTAAERHSPGSALFSQERRRAMDASQKTSDDPRDWLVDQGFENYTETDHETWRTLA